MKRILKWSAILAGICIVVAGVALAAWLHRCPDKLVFGSAGSQPSQDALIRASIRELAALLRRCPGRLEYRVAWTSGKSMLYSGGMIGREDDPLSGFAEIWGPVDDATIRAVAETGGGTNDLARLAHWEQRR
jgi:hypothetical protein